MNVGDTVKVLNNAEKCCFAEDAGSIGTIVDKRYHPADGEIFKVKSSAGVWEHCVKCITPVVVS